MSPQGRGRHRGPATVDEETAGPSQGRHRRPSPEEQGGWSG
ncbi:MAG TPA: hypothetical protein VFY14_11680 [Streptomyces sp.]|nr:hypothetical protein [Streptomyces sp.]